MRKKRPIEERFWAGVERGCSDACWNWKRTKTKGYGTLGLGGRGGKCVYAHRLSWEIANGRSVPAGLCVCHTCDNPACVNPAHLWLGTTRENAIDSVIKGRASSPKKRRPGVLNGRAILTEAAVVQVRAAYAAAPRGPKGRIRSGALAAMAQRFGLCPDAIREVAKGKLWREVA